MNTKVIEKLEKSLKYGDKELEICTVKISDLKYLIQEYKEQDTDLYEANNRINDLLDIVKQKDKIINEILKTWKQDDVRSIAELKKYFEERCK